MTYHIRQHHLNEKDKEQLENIRENHLNEEEKEKLESIQNNRNNNETNKSIPQENPQDDLQKSYPGVNYFKIIPVSSIIASKKGSPMKSENDTQNDEDFDMLELHEQDDKNNVDNEDRLQDQEIEDMVIF